jgi:hypothetical protein
LIEKSSKKYLIAKIGTKIHICDAHSPADIKKKQLLDPNLLIGDRIFDIKNGAIYSIVTGFADYSPNLE